MSVKRNKETALIERKDILDQMFTQVHYEKQKMIVAIPRSIVPFEPLVHEFFDANKEREDPGAAPDLFFSYVAGLCRSLILDGLHQTADTIWQEALAITRRWEVNNPTCKKIHKGSAFYFWGGLAIRQGDIRKGFLLIHASLTEDIRKHTGAEPFPDSPAWKLVALNGNSNQQFHKDLAQIGTDELELRLAAYRNISGSSFQFGDLQTRYIAQPDPILREVVFILTMAVFEVIQLRKSFELVGEDAGSNFRAQLVANSLLDLSQVVEETIRFKSQLRGHRDTFRIQAEHLVDAVNAIHSANLWKKPIETLIYINGKRENDTDVVVRTLVRPSAGTAIGVHKGSLTHIPSQLERDLWLTYFIRNEAAHSLKSKRVLRELFDDIYQSILNTLFVTIETLYP